MGRRNARRAESRYGCRAVVPRRRSRRSSRSMEPSGPGPVAKGWYRASFASEPSLDHGDADADGHQGRAAPGRGGLRPSLTADTIGVAWMSGRGEETALSRTRKLTGEVIEGRYCPFQTARRHEFWYHIFLLVVLARLPNYRKSTS